MLAYNAQWDQFARELGPTLANLRQDQFLILETQRDVYYVQFAGHGSFGMRAEAVSNGYLDGTRRLSAKACSKLLELGWNAPTIIPDLVSDRRGYKGYRQITSATSACPCPTVRLPT